jgi:hypothetical protein
VNGVVVTLNVLKNNGSFESFNNTATSGSGGSGIAVFPNFYIDKAGGYTILATASIFGVPTKSVTSNLFNISGL